MAGSATRMPRPSSPRQSSRAAGASAIWSRRWVSLVASRLRLLSGMADSTPVVVPSMFESAPVAPWGVINPVRRGPILLASPCWESQQGLLLSGTWHVRCSASEKGTEVCSRADCASVFAARSPQPAARSLVGMLHSRPGRRRPTSGWFRRFLPSFSLRNRTSGWF